MSFPGPEPRLPYPVLESAQNSSWHRIGSQEIFVEQVNEQNGYTLIGGFRKLKKNLKKKCLFNLFILEGKSTNIEEEGEIDSLLSTELEVGLNPRTLRP